MFAAQAPKSLGFNLADKGIFLCQAEIRSLELISAQSGLHIKQISGGVFPPAGAAEDYKRGPIPLRQSHQLPVNYSKIESREHGKYGDLFFLFFLRLRLGATERPPVRPMWNNAIRVESVKNILSWSFYIVVFVWYQLPNTNY